jgi:hypothetical protein
MKVLFAATASLCAWAVCAWAQTGLVRPQLGTMLDSSGAARPVYGVPGSVTLGDAAATGVLASACSRQLCLLKIDSALLSAAGSIPAPAGPAVFALDGVEAFVYFPESQQLAHWHGGQLDSTPLNVEGKILSLRVEGRAESGKIEAVIRRGERVSIERISPDGANLGITGSLPDDTRAAMLTGAGGVVFANRDTLVLLHADGTETRFEVAGAQAMFALGDGYVEVRAGSSTYAVRVDPGQERIFLLPEVPPSGVRQ